MSTARDPATDGGDRTAAEKDRVPGAGDDERENREEIASSGEPQRDALGNADGAS
jgi:hypothetical protein